MYLPMLLCGAQMGRLDWLKYCAYLHVSTTLPLKPLPTALLATLY